MTVSPDETAIYLSLPVLNLNASRLFYVEKLALFDRVSDTRISTNYKPSLIIDFVETGACHPIHFGIRLAQCNLIHRLKSNGVEHSVVSDLSGVSITIVDPSRHEIWVTSTDGQVT